MYNWQPKRRHGYKVLSKMIHDKKDYYSEMKTKSKVSSQINMGGRVRLRK